MKQFGHTLKHIFISITLVLTTFSVPMPIMAQVDTSLDQQKAECAKNTAAEWSLKLNKCVGKVEDRQTRHEVEDCAKITDIEQRKECHKKIAEQKTGLNSDPGSLPQGTGSGSAIMNAAGAAYTIIGLITNLGSGGKESTCTSKKIFGITSVAGTLSDIWLKIQAKKAMNALKDKYKLDVKNGAFDAQSKAFQYLKDEQQTVKEIAGREKKRNMLLMAGYGAAAVMAIYEMTPYGQNPDCYKKETPATPAKPAAQATPAAPAAPAAAAPAAPATDTVTQTAPAAPTTTTEPATQTGSPTPAAAEQATPVPPKVATVTPAAVEAGPSPKSEYSYRATGGPDSRNIRIEEMGPNGPTGNVAVNTANGTVVVNNRTGEFVRNVPEGSELSWKDGRSQTLPKFTAGNVADVNKANFTKDTMTIKKSNGSVNTYKRN